MSRILSQSVVEYRINRRKRNLNKTTSQILNISLLLCFMWVLLFIWRNRAGDNENRILYSPVSETYFSNTAKAVDRPSEPASSPQEIVDYIWLRESSRGQNNPVGSLANNCYSKGMWNELGWGGMDRQICFNSREEGVERVERYITENLIRHDSNISYILCMYRFGEEGMKSNGGEQCEYAKTFISSTQ